EPGKPHHRKRKIFGNVLRKNRPKSDTGGNEDSANPAQQRTRVSPKQPERKDGRQETDTRRNETVGVLIENSADPFRDREEEHVVAVTVRPVGHRQASLMAGHKAAHAD